MELEGSLPCSQAPTTCSYLDPNESTPSLTSVSFNIRCNIMLWSKRWSSKQSHFIRFTHQNLVWIFFSPVCYMSCLSHQPCFDNPNNIWYGMQIVKPFSMQFSSICFHVPAVRFRCSPQHPILKTLSLCFSFSVRDQVSALVLCIAVVMMFRWWTGREKPLKQMVSSMCHIKCAFTIFINAFLIFFCHWL